MGFNKIWIVLVLIVVVIVGLGTLIYNQAKGELVRFEENKPLPAAVLYDQEGKIIKRLGKGNVSVPINKVPKDLQNAILTTEAKNLQGTTIPQRVASNIFQPKGSWDRLKARILPSLLKRRHSERELLEMYLNNTYFGEGAHGVEAASQTYFGKSVEQVNLAESALLAALAMEPETASPYTKPKRALELRNNVLAQMEKEGKVSKDDYEEATSTSIDLEQHEPGQAHYFADYLSKILVEKLGEEQTFQGGLTVETTIDLELQELAERALQGNELQGSLVALDLEGNILAMVGGLNYVQHKTNLATTKQQQVASSLRPLIYATALREDWAMNHLVEDVQREFNNFQVTNAGDRYWGTVTMKHALAMDLNNAAVWSLNELGLDNFKKYLTGVNINLEPEDLKLNLAMGEIPSGISLLDLTAAYLPAVAGGLYSKPKGLIQVKDSDGKIVSTGEKQNRKRLLTEEQAFLLTDLLTAGLERGSTKELALDFPLAVTASTAHNGKTQWSIGYTPNLLVGVFVQIPEESGDEIPPLAAGKVWVEFVNEVSKDLEEFDFEVPENVETGVLIDIFTGLLANQRCPQVEMDAFIKGTEPTEMAPCAIPPAPPVTQREPTRPTRPPAPPPEPKPEPPTPPPAEPEPELPTPPPAEPEPELPIPPPIEPEPPAEPQQPAPPPVEPSEPIVPMVPIEPIEPVEPEIPGDGEE